MDKLDVFMKRMKKLGIDLRLASNFPWIYITHINGMAVKERFKADHGFTIGFIPIRPGQSFKFSDIGEIFALIRSYCLR